VRCCAKCLAWTGFRSSGQAGPPSGRRSHARSETDLLSTARRAGTPLLIDPQTYYLQGLQHPNDPWAALPFGHPSVWTPSQASCPKAQQDLVARVVDYQVSHGATAIIPVYNYIDRLDSEWITMQAALWRRTRDHLDHNEIALPVIAVMAVGWRVRLVQTNPLVTQVDWRALSAISAVSQRPSTRQPGRARRIAIVTLRFRSSGARERRSHVRSRLCGSAVPGLVKRPGAGHRSGGTATAACGRER
jgi:hypothetical protein